MMEEFKRKYGSNFGWAVIAAEDHEPRDEDMQAGVHRHAFLGTKKRFQTRNARFWDIEWEGRAYHPHYEPIKKGDKSKANVLEYCIKDGQYISEGTFKDLPFSVATYLAAHGGKQSYTFTWAAQQIQAGKSMDELDDEAPGLVLREKRKLDDYITFQEEKKERKTVRPKFPGFQDSDSDDSGWQQVIDWANHNFLQSRQPRQKQLWLWSETYGVGKSYPWDVLITPYFKKYEWLAGEKQDNELLTCDFIFMDEFAGNVPVHKLKRLAQMYGMNTDIKYRRQSVFSRNVPLIITSNEPPHKVFKNCSREHLESLEDRFLIVKVEWEYHMQLKEVILVPPTPPRLASPPNPLLLGTPDVVSATPRVGLDDDPIEDSTEDSQLSEQSLAEKYRN